MISQAINTVRVLLGLLVTCPALLAGDQSLTGKRDLRLWYEQPAQKWVEALPVGNGRLGAMVFGGTKAETIQLNEESIWAGPPVPEDQPGAREAIAEVRRLLFEDRYVEAEQIVQRDVLAKRISPRSYQTLGELKIETIGAGDHSDYHRQLDLRTGVATTRFKSGGVAHLRRVFASATDDVIVAEFSTAGDEPVQVEIGLTRPDAQVGAVENRLFVTGQARHGDTQPGVKFRGELLVARGDCEAVGDKLKITGDDKIVILLTAATDYNRADTSQPLAVDLEAKCREILTAAASKSIDRLLADSVADHQELFERVSIDLGPAPNKSAANESASDKPTDARLAAVRNGANDPALVALYFQYGRYLLIGSSRPGNLPANLQGVWNHHMEAPWNSDYHLNINLQMNYWPAEVTHLSECHLPLFDFVERLLPAARATADNLGCRGMCGGHVTDVWHFATAGTGRPVWGMWVHGPAWCTQHFMEHYRYTLDEQFLRDRAYPILMESALFYCDWLTEDPETGLLVSGPSTSPENTFYTPDGEVVAISMGCGMDHQIIWDVFTNTLEAAEILGIKNDETREVREKLSRLAPPKIGADGRLMEWAKEFREHQPGHRHMSHLFGLHPGHQFNAEATPELMAAAKESLEDRLRRGGGHTGWSRAWIINFWARFKDADRAHENVQALLAKSTYPNLLDAHPPFQIDGNFGGTAGIAEMLLQSHVETDNGYLIELLPCLPDEWSSGNVRGLRARGDFEIDMTWKAGELTAAELKSESGSTCTILYDGRKVELQTNAGDECDLMPKLRPQKLTMLAASVSSSSTSRAGTPPPDPNPSESEGETSTPKRTFEKSIQGFDRSGGGRAGARR